MADVRLLLACLLSTALLTLGATPAQAQTPFLRTSSSWRTCVRTLDGTKTKISRSQRTVIIVNQRSRTYARVSFWVRRSGACSLTRKFLTSTARIGRNGTVDGRKRKQGSGTTPRGTYTITETFGNGPAPYTSMPYHRVRKGDYWVGDNKSRYYNTLRNSADGGFRWRLPQSNINSSENLRAFGAQYRYVAVINFNRSPDDRVAYRGFGIFLHVKNGRGTAGCIGISAAQMKQVLRYLRPGDKITIRR
jgi:L,D-peptidoglycan transpeptidase YkuD (ErfK/YbiS/YcfS/YnhG family)